MLSGSYFQNHVDVGWRYVGGEHLIEYHVEERQGMRVCRGMVSRRKPGRLSSLNPAIITAPELLALAYRGLAQEQFALGA